MLASVHILLGQGKSRGGKEPADRVAEIRKVAQFLKKRTQDKTAWSRNLILLGDFNIFTTDPDGEAFGELLDAGFEIPDSLRAFTTNASRIRHYDQIAFRIQKTASTGPATVVSLIISSTSFGPTKRRSMPTRWQSIQKDFQRKDAHRQAENQLLQNLLANASDVRPSADVGGVEDRFFRAIPEAEAGRLGVVDAYRKAQGHMFSSLFISFIRCRTGYI